MFYRPEKETEQLPWRRLPAEEAKLATTTVIFGIPNVLPGGVDVSRAGNNEYRESCCSPSCWHDSAEEPARMWHTRLQPIAYSARTNGPFLQLRLPQHRPRNAEMRGQTVPHSPRDEDAPESALWDAENMQRGQLEVSWSEQRVGKVT
ncbi:hypothetical protein D4764_01G0019750 [Takifugu flavidus]|uniref:Uncharacterized protein n=1 Tax=Takifugu flavidus TaxID=433684 RepID=A0A5C6PUC6_9TELE|nr:hypothetical protein D4764_01G0019750 [Takifugu flavidus]